MADMFSNIATQLPAYEEFVTILQKRAAYRGENHTRLAKALAYLYVDILSFCHSAYALFINKKPSMANPKFQSIVAHTSQVLRLNLA